VGCDGVRGVACALVGVDKEGSVAMPMQVLELSDGGYTRKEGGQLQSSKQWNWPIYVGREWREVSRERWWCCKCRWTALFRGVHHAKSEV